MIFPFVIGIVAGVTAVTALRNPKVQGMARNAGQGIRSGVETAVGSGMARLRRKRACDPCDPPAAAGEADAEVTAAASEIAFVDAAAKPRPRRKAKVTTPKTEA